jgi:hypothetical protein
MVGIAVGVWGDTGEIAYITPYGYHRIPNMNQIKPYENQTLSPDEVNVSTQQ